MDSIRRSVRLSVCLPVCLSVRHNLKPKVLNDCLGYCIKNLTDMLIPQKALGTLSFLMIGTKSKMVNSKLIKTYLDPYNFFYLSEIRSIFASRLATSCLII